MKQLDMFQHQAELPVPMPAPVRGLLAEVTPAAAQVDRAIPVLRERPGQPAVRYMHPTSMQTWTGRGKQPRWITEWIESGKSLDALRVPGVAHA